MKIIQHEQGSQEWLDWRRSGIGASDICVIMGSNKYSTPLKLWEVKCGFSEGPVSNTAMRHGTANEPIVREKVNEELTLDLKPMCVEDEDMSYMRASLDGYDPSREVLVEIKCPFSDRILNKSASGDLEAYWVDQIQWQMMITDLYLGHIAVWDYRTDKINYFDIKRDEERIALMREKAKEFWLNVQLGKPPEGVKGDIKQIDSPALKALFEEYMSASVAIQSLEKAKSRLKQEIESFGDQGTFECSGYKAVWNEPRSTYDYTAMKDDGIELDKYKNVVGNGFYTIRLPKET